MLILAGRQCKRISGTSERARTGRFLSSGNRELLGVIIMFIIHPGRARTCHEAELMTSSYIWVGHRNVLYSQLRVSFVILLCCGPRILML